MSIKNVFFILCILSSVCVNAQIEDKMLYDLTLLQKCLKTSDYNVADSILQIIQSQCEVSDNDTVLLAYAEAKARCLMYGHKQYEAAIPHFKTANILREKLDYKWVNYLDNYYSIAWAYHVLNDRDNAERYYRKALIKSVAVEGHEGFRSNIYNGLAKLYEEKGDSILADACLKRIADADTNKVYDAEDYAYIEWENKQWDSINYYVKLQRYQEASDAYVVLIDGIRKAGWKKETLLLALESRGILLARYLNNYTESIPLFKELIQYSDVNNHNSSICSAYCNLLLCYAVTKKNKALRKIINKAYEYLNQANVEGYLPAMVYRFAGNGYYWKEDYKSAIYYYEQYLTKLTEREEDNSYQEIVNQLSVAYIKENYPIKAESILTSLLITDKVSMELNDTNTLALVYHNLGRSLMLQNKYKEALEYFEQSKEIQKNISGTISELTKNYIYQCQNNL